MSGLATIKIEDILRVGLTKTYSRCVYLLPMCLGFAALIIKSIPAIAVSFEIIPDVWSIDYTVWSVPFQDIAWEICGIACLLTIPLYCLSYRKDLEINSIKGRYLIPQNGMSTADIAAFQQAILQIKAAHNDLPES